MVNMRVDQLAGPGGDEESVRILLLCDTGAKPLPIFFSLLVRRKNRLDRDKSFPAIPKVCVPVSLSGMMNF
jgi:hypothetical protein